MALRPIVAAATEMVQQSCTEVVVPRKPVDVARLIQVVVIRIESRQCRRAVRSWRLQVAIVAVVKRDAIFLANELIELDTELVCRLDFAARGGHIVIQYVAGCAGSFDIGLDLSAGT